MSSDSIRDRLGGEDEGRTGRYGEQNSGGDSQGSDVTSSDFRQTDSRSDLQSTGHGAGQTVPGPVNAVDEGLSRTKEGGTGHRQLTERERRSGEAKVSALFIMAIVGVLGFVVSYIVVPFTFGDRHSTLYTPLLGVFMAMALIGVGAGAVVWAKALMDDEEVVQERHHFASDDADRAEAVALIKDGFEATGLPRRSLLRNTMLLGAGSLAILPVPLLFDLGPFRHKERALRNTAWKKNMRLVDEMGLPIKIGDLDVGGIKTVYPDVADGRRSEIAATSASLLIRLDPLDLHPRESRKDWAVDGHIVFSLICTHLGCPVKLYEQQTHHLFCPCHQSTFDVTHEAKPLFGPAARNLPQLAISVDSDGYFVAQGDYTEPVGPSFWERNSQ